MSNPLKIIIAGLGTVGQGTLSLLDDHKDIISKKLGRPLEIVGISARNRNQDRGVDISSLPWFDDCVQMAKDCDAHMAIELIGGSEGPAKAFCEAALTHGKHVITANKALLATHGLTLAKLAEENKKALFFEGAIGGGIPIVKGLKEGLSANKIQKIYGILNGTSNYILTQMEKNEIDFDEALQEAQDLGYAEADPSFDIDGIDTAHKLSLLSSLSFGTEINSEDIVIEGIRHISLLDIHFADDFGYKIKLLGISERKDNKIQQRVHPTMVPEDSTLARIDKATNAVLPIGDYVGPTCFTGPGAGSRETASAVVADIIECGQLTHHHLPLPLGIPLKELQPFSTADFGHHKGRFYIRLLAKDQPGVLADIATICKDESISLASMIQPEDQDSNHVPIVFITHETTEKAIQNALDKMAALSSVIKRPLRIPIEMF